VNPRMLNTLKGVILKPGESGITIRRGIKWADAQKGDRLILTVGRPPEDKLVGAGLVQSVAMMRFCDIPDQVWPQMHTDNKTYETVLAAMHRAYEGFCTKEVVVVLKYQLEQEYQ